MSSVRKLRLIIVDVTIFSLDMLVCSLPTSLSFTPIVDLGDRWTCFKRGEHPFPPELACSPVSLASREATTAKNELNE